MARKMASAAAVKAKQTGRIHRRKFRVICAPFRRRRGVEKGATLAVSPSAVNFIVRDQFKVFVEGGYQFSARQALNNVRTKVRRGYRCSGCKVRLVSSPPGTHLTPNLTCVQ